MVLAEYTSPMKIQPILSKVKARAGKVLRRMEETLSKDQIVDETTVQPVIADISADHKHVWQRGLLPGSIWVKICKGCHQQVKITKDAWDKI